MYAELIQWYKNERDRYDFRRERNPYRTWITEIFLQQTQIAAGREKLKVFLKKFPDVRVLAAAPVTEVLETFQGMGYYSRARNMHRAAQYIVANYAGTVPVSYSELIKISGIGHYTAAIIASIHSGEKVLALDANHARVLSRLFAIGSPQGSKKFQEAIHRAAAPFFDIKMSPGDVNESLMQWGQLICKKRPLCEKCFAVRECKAYQRNEVLIFPQKAARAEATELLWLMLVHRKRDTYQIFQNVSQLPFLKGELMFPGILSMPQKEARLPDRIAASLAKKVQSRAHSLPVDFKHAITRYKISVKLIITDTALSGGEWLTPRAMRTRCHSSLMQKAIQRLDKLEFG